MTWSAGRLLLVIIAVSTLAGAIFGLVNQDEEGNVNVWVSTLAGLTISPIIASFELFALPRIARRMPFLAVTATRIAVYLPVMVICIIISTLIVTGAVPALTGIGMRTGLLFSVVGTAFFILLISVVQLVGGRALLDIVSARYFNPRAERCLLMFLDITSSTTIAENIGDIRYHQLLSDVFATLSRIVTDHGGEVHKYVGDEMIAVWRVGTPEQNARILKCFVACLAAMERDADKYQNKFELVPAFRAGLHMGTVVAGEIGATRREVALIGDAMNITARIEEACRDVGEAALASGELQEACALPDGLVLENVGDRLLRGKTVPVTLYALRTEDEPKRSEIKVADAASG